MNKKQLLSALLAGALSLSMAAPALAAEAEAPAPSYPVLTQDGAQYVPLRAIAEDLGLSVAWDQATLTATVSNDVWSIQLQPMANTADVSYVEGAVEAPILLQDDRIYIDPDFLAQYADTVVTVDGESATAAADAMAGTRNAIRANDYGVKQSYEYERYEVMVPMDDGVKLRTIVYKPVGEGPWPTAFTRGPYPEQEATKDALGEEYASRGFAYVYQYCLSLIHI